MSTAHSIACLNPSIKKKRSNGALFIFEPILPQALSVYTHVNITAILIHPAHTIPSTTGNHPSTFRVNQATILYNMQHTITQISKTISHALRHAPAEYGLTLDPQGWVSIADLLAALQARGMQADESTLHAMLAQSEKKRFEMLEGKIRAYYGHSTEEKIVKQVVEPPEILYHGTVAGNLESILEKGLLPMGRQYVHLSADEKTARMVGSRHAGKVVILQVQAREAYKAGIAFYQENNGVWLSDAVPGGYLVGG